MIEPVHDTLDRRLDFARRHVRAKDGHAFSTEGRSWVIDELFRPAGGFRLWPHDPPSQCAECADRIGEIVEHPNDNPTLACTCKGLDARPIIVTALNLQRQDGKTFSTAAFVLSALFQSRNKSIAFLCAAEDQALRIFNEVYVEAIGRDKQLSSLAEISRQRIDVPRLHNTFEALSASHRSVTGRTRTHIVIDEARDIEARVAVALLPSVFAMHGVECPRGHVQITAAEAAKPGAPVACTACAARLVPWYGRIIITSSSGVTEDTERDWFYEMFEELKIKPRAEYHAFQSFDMLNPQKSATITNAIGDVFGSLQSTKHYIASEVGNQWTRRGEDFVSSADIDRVVDRSLVNLESCTDQCVAFLDTSLRGDKTSLVILADESDSGKPAWERVYVARMDIWDPAKLPGHVIDDKAIDAHLCDVIPLYPSLRVLRVDTRGMRWAQDLVISMRRRAGAWTKKIKNWESNRNEGVSGWALLQERILTGTIRLPDNADMRREFLGTALKQNSRGQIVVTDRNRRASHRDCTESLAMCCYFAHQDRAMSRNARFASVVAGSRSMRETIDRTSRARKSVFRSGRF